MRGRGVRVRSQRAANELAHDSDSDRGNAHETQRTLAQREPAPSNDEIPAKLFAKPRPRLPACDLGSALPVRPTQHVVRPQPSVVQVVKRPRVMQRTSGATGHGDVANEARVLGAAEPSTLAPQIRDYRPEMVVETTCWPPAEARRGSIAPN